MWSVRRRLHPILSGVGPNVHRDLPVLDVPTGKLALAHATLGFFPGTLLGMYSAPNRREWMTGDHRDGVVRC